MLHIDIFVAYALFPQLRLYVWVDLGERQQITNAVMSRKNGVPGHSWL